MLKTLKIWFKENRERFKIPKGVQDVLPVHSLYGDGIFLVRRGGFFGDNKYSKTFRFTDINYAVASREDKESMFLDYSELLNSLDSGATAKITVRASRLSRADYEANILIPLTGEGLDKYRRELNDLLLKKSTESNAIVLDKTILPFPSARRTSGKRGRTLPAWARTCPLTSPVLALNVRKWT